MTGEQIDIVVLFISLLVSLTVAIGNLILLQRANARSAEWERLYLRSMKMCDELLTMIERLPGSIAK